MTRIVTRHLILAFLPLFFGLAASGWFAYEQRACGGLVGPLFAAKCGRIQAEYRLLFQLGGTALGGVISALVGICLERRRLVREIPAPGRSGITPG